MMYLAVAVAAFAASVATFFSGFGLGTLLMPVFAVFFPIPTAVAATAVVHMLNNVAKLVLMGRHASIPTALRFGVPAVAAAFAGAAQLNELASMNVVATYSLNGHPRRITWIGLVTGLLIVAFTAIDLLPMAERLRIGAKWLPVGGLLSGFFGGLSGHQGAFRSMFLVKQPLTKEQFIGTGVVCAIAVDAARLTIYGAGAAGTFATGDRAGSTVSARLIKKVTIGAVQKTVAAFLILLAVGLAAGLV
jgi:uncharacterized membrane protein YfcA